MLAIDIFFAVVLGWAFLSGLRRGLFRVLGSLVGLVVGAWVASHYYLWVYDWLFGHFQQSWFVNKVAIFIILFLLSSNLAAIIFMAVGRMIESIMVIPLMKTFSHLLGAVLNLGVTALTWGLLLFFFSRYLPTTNTIGQQLSESFFVPYLMTIGKILSPLLPIVLKQMQTLW